MTDKALQPRTPHNVEILLRVYSALVFIGLFISAFADPRLKLTYWYPVPMAVLLGTWALFSAALSTLLTRSYRQRRCLPEYAETKAASPLLGVLPVIAWVAFFLISRNYCNRDPDLALRYLIIPFAVVMAPLSLLSAALPTRQALTVAIPVAGVALTLVTILVTIDGQEGMFWDLQYNLGFAAIFIITASIGSLVMWPLWLWLWRSERSLRSRHMATPAAPVNARGDSANRPATGISSSTRGAPGPTNTGSLQTCANCDGMIGRLEVSRHYAGQTVCSACFKKLSSA